MNKTLLAVVLVIVCSIPVLAQTKPVTTISEALSVTFKEIGKSNVRITELERKVAGMQKQITILHAKKADKK